MLHSLSVLYGTPEPRWKSQSQRQAVLGAASGNHHMVVTIACGGGKTLVCLLPAFARYRAGGKRKMTIVVVPYVFLLLCHFSSITQLVGVQQDFVVAYMTGSDCSQFELPSVFDGDRFPQLLLVTVDAMANLLRYHVEILREFSENNHLHNIVVDEVHTLFLEWSFRQGALQWMKYLAQFNVPVVLMSGTLPPKLVMRAKQFFGLSSTKDVRGDDLILSLIHI